MVRLIESTHPHELREHRRTILTIERNGLAAALHPGKKTATRLEVFDPLSIASQKKRHYSVWWSQSSTRSPDLTPPALYRKISSSTNANFW